MYYIEDCAHSSQKAFIRTIKRLLIVIGDDFRWPKSHVMCWSSDEISLKNDTEYERVVLLHLLRRLEKW